MYNVNQKKKKKKTAEELSNVVTTFIKIYLNMLVAVYCMNYP